MWVLSRFLLLLLLVSVPVCSGFWTSAAPTFSRRHVDRSILASKKRENDLDCPEQPPINVIVVGKVIVDEYGHPDDPFPNVTVGGGGPQSAMGAALALAARTSAASVSGRPAQPPPQPVTFVAPVGDLDFSSNEETLLVQLLTPALQHPLQFYRGKNLVTPRIRLWHDDKQVLQWYALNDSFGNIGAGGLWASLPCLKNYIDLLAEYQLYTTTTNSNSNTKPILHIISEGGAGAPGANGDSMPLMDAQVLDKISFLGVEPILFPNQLGVVSERDATHCARLMQQILNSVQEHGGRSPNGGGTVVFSPDMAAYQAMENANCLPESPSLDSWAVRNGPKGSKLIITTSDKASDKATNIPAATLRQLVNPTGAGNAYAAAYTALRGSGDDALESACLAAGVGAVFCEYNHCPPYTWDTIDRVVEAARQVQSQIREATQTTSQS